MLAPAFGALFLFAMFAACSIALGVTCAVLYLLRWRKVGRVFGILASASFALFLVVYWQVYGFTWFG
jgi:hypothetical protein